MSDLSLWVNLNKLVMMLKYNINKTVLLKKFNWKDLGRQAKW